MTKVLVCTHREIACEFKAEGATVDEVVQVVAAHIKNDHDQPITAGLFADLRAATRDG